MEFGVVVLNYNAYESTIACVRSLLRCSPKPGCVIVVDNRSPNESLAALTNEFASLDLVRVVDSGRNGGYSFGNNVGIRYLRERGARNVLIATGDTEVISQDLFRLLGMAIGPRTGVLGPQIIGPEGFQNPSVAKLNIKYMLDLVWIRNGMPGLRLRRVITRLLRWKRSSAGPAQSDTGHNPGRGQSGARKVYMLHGAFVCLTERFLERLRELDERIFMFGEEDLLAWNCVDGGFDQLLLNDALVRHEDDRSINLTWGGQARRFISDEQKKSGKVLKDAIDLQRLIRLWWTGQREF